MAIIFSFYPVPQIFLPNDYKVFYKFVGITTKVPFSVDLQSYLNHDPHGTDFHNENLRFVHGNIKGFQMILIQTRKDLLENVNTILLPITSKHTRC